MAVESNITEDNHWFVGENKVIPGRVFAANGTTPLDITDYKLQFDIWRTDKHSGTPMMSLSTDDGDIVILPQTGDDIGKYEVTVDDGGYGDLIPGDWFYTVRHMDDNEITVFTYGTVRLL